MSETNESNDNLNDLSNMNDEDFSGIMDDEGANASPSSGGTISQFHDLPVTLSLRVDSIDIPIGDLLSLDEGQVLPLNKKSDDPLDVIVNGKFIARAEPVVVDGRYGMRIVEVINNGQKGSVESGK